MKPDDLLMETYERFVLGNSEDLKATQMLKVTVSRCKLINTLRGVFRNPNLIFAGRTSAWAILNVSPGALTFLCQPFFHSKFCKLRGFQLRLNSPFHG